MLFVFKLLSLLFLVPVLAQTYDSNVFNDDVLGLIVFKAGIIDPEAKLASWNEEDEKPCKWVGVGCDETTGRVTELTLDGFSLSGHIGRGLLRLQFLQRLSLSRNSFTGPINSGLGQFGSLQVLDLSENKLSGTIPDEFFQQCGSLRVISLAKNNLTGLIPDSLTWCPSLVSISLSSNWFSGKIPAGMWFMRGLKSLDLSNNQLEGELPRGFGNLYNLTDVKLQNNWLSGELPVDIGACSKLETIDFSHNYLSGWLPESMQKLNSCTSLILRGNALLGQVPDWIGELTSLERLDLSSNNFSGEVSFAIGDLHQLKELNFSMNHLTGALPRSVSNCIDLVSLDMSHNLLTGNVPLWMFKTGLQRVSLSGNRFSGSLENVSSSSQSLRVLDLSLNALSGQVPSGIGMFRSLHSLNLSMNNLVGSIPSSLGDLKELSTLDLSSNRINGTIPPEIGGATSLKELKLQKNFIRGRIPIQIENCSSLTSLVLSENNITGPVPNVVANLSNLEQVDLSMNYLSGLLPKELTNLSHLRSFNIAHNHFQGELPVGGFFNTISLSSVLGNPSLCGSIVNRACPAVHPKPIVLNPNSSSDSPNPGPLSLNHRHKIILSISALIAIGAAVFIALGVIAVSVLNIHVRSSMLRSSPSLTLSGEELSGSPSTDGNYGKLVMFSGHAEFVVGTHALLNKDCELGRGGFGVVYQTILRDGRAVAIKKLTVSSLIKSQEDFEVEVRKLGKIRHNNVVTLEGYYWTPSLQLLIYEYVPSGSLYKNLHDGSDGDSLTWRQRFNIVLGMAKGLAHLHQMNITHYNLKSTNILIDNKGEAKVADSGLARLLPMLDHCILSSKIQSALGYMAPEFACRTVKITEKCDVYGFGVLVLEVVTGKKPVEYMEDDVVVLTEMVRGALEDGKVEECIDGKLERSFPVEEAIPVIKLGLVCASQVPSNRPDMAEVVNILELIQCPSEGQESERISP